MKFIKTLTLLTFVMLLSGADLVYGQADYFAGTSYLSPQPQTSTLITPSCAQPIPGYSYFWDNPFVVTPECAAAISYINAGYTCYYQTKTSGGVYDYFQTTCTRAIPVSYGATRLSDFSLQGYTAGGGATRAVPWSRSAWDKPSPFIYLQNAPDGKVSVSLDSKLDKFFPAPAFNDTNSWEVVSEGGELTLEGEPVDHLFYELSLNKLELSRQGQNFDSKESLTSFLKDSDFLSELGFSEQEKENSLNYLLPQIAHSKTENYYYLTILDEETVESVSTLDINPAPEQVVRQYFAVYPSAVPVTTTGDFIFPTQPKETDGFVVKETGELLLGDSMFVTFK